MEKLLKIFLTVLIFIILFLVLDRIAYTLDYKTLLKDTKPGTWFPENNYTLSIRKNSNKYTHILNNQIYNRHINTDSKLNPIYVFGCSFAFGEYINKKDTFMAALAQLTGRPVYCFALPGFSVQHMLYQLQNLDFPKTKPPKYLIYVFIGDHIRRMQSDFFMPFLRHYEVIYNNKNGKLKLKTRQEYTFDIFYIVRKLKCKTSEYKLKLPIFEKYNTNLLCQHFEEIQNEINEKYPNSEFIILVYDTFETNINWEYIREKGFNVIETEKFTKEDLFSEKYNRNAHPTKQAWDLITPLFVKEAEIK